jgi:hypothetical protein
LARIAAVGRVLPARQISVPLSDQFYQCFTLLPDIASAKGNYDIAFTDDSGQVLRNQFSIGDPGYIFLPVAKYLSSKTFC